MNTIDLPGMTAISLQPEEIRQRWMDLGLVLFVALSEPIFGSAYFALHGDYTASLVQIISGMMRELGGIAVLLYVLQRRGRGLSYFGERVDWKDLPRGMALCAASSLVMTAAYYAYCYGYFFKTGHMPAALAVSKALGIHRTVGWLFYFLLSPIFEELIVRGFLMTEIAALMNMPMAIAASTLLQISYHGYQGTTNAVMVGAGFLLLSLYYAKTNRLAPVILAHLLQDLYAFATLHR